MMSGVEFATDATRRMDFSGIGDKVFVDNVVALANDHLDALNRVIILDAQCNNYEFALNAIRDIFDDVPGGNLIEQARLLAERYRALNTLPAATGFVSRGGDA